MQTDEFIDLFEQIEVNLENPRIKQVLENENFDLIDFQHKIQDYIKHADIVYHAEGSRLFNTTIEKAKEILKYSQHSNFIGSVHNFINAALYLSKHAPNDQLLADEKIQTLITEEEFSQRYDLLIDLLNFEPDESNLILKTPSEKKEFKVFKSNINSLLIRAGQKQTPMTITKERFLNDAYGRNKYNYPSYEPIIISKIMDNSIFKGITSSTHNNDLTEALTNQINKQKEEILILRNKLENLEENEEKLASKNEQINQMFTLAQNAKKEYDDAKEAAINDTKLKESVKYWEEKQDKHKHRFWNYGSLAIALIIALIIGLYFIISIHNINFQTTPQNTNSISTVIDFNASQKEKNISKTTTLKSNINDTNQTAQNILLDNPIDYLHYFGWYALLIFTSSSALWIIRITVKIALSNLHLSEDAHERVVMIKTYLAFISEGHGLEEKDKQLIMTSLFRPSNIGIIQDESSITVADIVSSLKGK